MTLMGGATLMPGYSQEYPTFMPKKYLYINYTRMYMLWWAVFSISQVKTPLPSDVLASTLTAHLKALPGGPRKQKLEPIPAQSLLRFPTMVAGLQIMTAGSS
jgi:hypothetical protein